MNACLTNPLTVLHPPGPSPSFSWTPTDRATLSELLRRVRNFKAVIERSLSSKVLPGSVSLDFDLTNRGQLLPA